MAKKVAEKPKKKTGKASSLTPASRGKPIAKKTATAKPPEKKPVEKKPVEKKPVEKKLKEKAPIEKVEKVEIKIENIEKAEVVKPTPKTLSQGGSEKAKPARSSKAKAVETPKLSPADDPELQKLQQKWLSYFDKSRGEPARDYDMSLTYEAKTPLQHKVLGWGYILSNQFDRLEVLFQSGIRILISNYKKNSAP